MMKMAVTKQQSLLLPNFIIIIIIILLIIPNPEAKSVIEPCTSSDSCSSLLSYRLPWDSKPSEIAHRFQLPIPDILAFNSIDPTSPPSWNLILPSGSTIRIPLPCPCTDGIRRSVSTTYTATETDTLESISEGYGGLVSAEQIRGFNGMGVNGSVVAGQRLVVPLPCTCFNNSDDGGDGGTEEDTAVYMSYVVGGEEGLKGIGAKFGRSVKELQSVNGLDQPSVDPGDILAVPLPACSSRGLNWYKDSLTVPNGSFALIANGCIKCGCSQTDTDLLSLQCSPSDLVSSCPPLQCQGSDLYIGDVHEEKTEHGCSVTSCVYHGHYGHRIFQSLVNSTKTQCSATGNHATVSPFLSSSTSSLLPLTTMSPSPSASPSSVGLSGTDSSSHPNNIKNSNVSSNIRLYSQASFLALLLLELAFYVLSR